LRWSLEYATVDFEEGLMKAISSVFPEVRLIGCLFHFKQAIWRTASNMGLKSKTSIKDPKTGNKSTKMEITSKLIDELSRYSWNKKETKEEYKKGIQKLKQSYNEHKEYINLIEFYESNWLPYILDGTIYYQDLKYNLDRLRANSILEKYHAELKECLPTSPRWEQLVNFLVEKEKNLVELQTKREKQGIIRENTKWGKKYFPGKSVKYKKAGFTGFESIDNSENEKESSINSINEQDNFEEEKDSEDVFMNENEFLVFNCNWIKWHQNSCRYDSFLTVFCLCLFSKHQDIFEAESFRENCSFRAAYNFLVKTAQHINTNGFEKRFDLWSFMNLPIHLSATGLSKVPLDPAPVGKFGSVSTLLTLFNALSYMQIYSIVGTNCYKCHSKSCQRSLFKVPIIFEEVPALSVQDCINYYFSKKRNLFCSICISNTKSEQSLLINSPPYLILYFETEGQPINFEGKGFIYSDEINLYVVEGESYNFKEKKPIKYRLIATINSPTQIHFNCSFKNPKINGIIYSGWFFHDGLQNKGNIVFKKSFEVMLNENPFVLFYERCDL